MQSGINPNVAMWLNVVFLVLTAIGAGTLSFGNLDAGTVATVKSLAADAAIIISAINVVFHAFSSPASGPMLRR